MAEERRSSPRKPARALTSPAQLENAPGREELRRALEVLEAVVSDRAILAQLSQDERTRLLVAAGRTVHPDLQQKRRLVRSLRSAERRRAEARDRSLLRATGIRAARQAEVFVPPPRALPAGEPQAEREVGTPKRCYVCKTEYRRVHFFYDAMCPPLRRAQLREALPDRGPARAGRAHHRRARQDRLPGRAHAAARGRARRSRPRASRTTPPQRYAREPDFADWTRPARSSTASTCATRRASSCSRSHVERDLERLDMLINNAARRCAGRRASTRTCSSSRSARSSSPRELQPLRRAASTSARAPARRQPRPRGRAGAAADSARRLVAWRGGGPAWDFATRRALSQVPLRLRRRRRGARTSSPRARSTPTCSRSTCAR